MRGGREDLRNPVGHGSQKLYRNRENLSGPFCLAPCLASGPARPTGHLNTWSQKTDAVVPVERHLVFIRFNELYIPHRLAMVMSLQESGETIR